MECPKCHFDNPADSKYCKECGTKVSPPVTETIEAPKEELTRGSTFAERYDIIEELGKGGMGRVYRVEDKKLNQEVALKLIKPEIAKEKKTIERFRNELKIARNIRHKNVCGMFDLGEREGSYFITMEYVRGEDLKSLIRKMGQLSAGQAIAIIKNICDGLIEAHRGGVIHRDLKPSNIMVDKDGYARIMDFGISRYVKGKGITDTGAMIGTPEYMSPEQVEGKEIDQRTDIYSLGVILYEMVTGRVPFEGDTALTVAVKHKTEEPKDPREFNAQLTDDLSQLILKCLEKDMEKRYQSAVELRAELENIEKDISTTKRVIPEKKPITSKEITVTLGIKKLVIPAIVILIILGAILGYLLLRPKEKVLQFVHPVQITSAVGVEDYPTWSPDNSRLAYQSNQSGNWDIWVTQVDGGPAVNRTEDHAGMDMNPSWSPDGRQIAFWSDRDGGGYFVMSALAGPPRKVK
ncbi:MAG: protein kinase, partial [candidate division Zixibacteria bacterium]|nr:protein kinase [candidate division Zixibacteria bacterium]